MFEIELQRLILNSLHDNNYDLTEAKTPIVTAKNIEILDYIWVEIKVFPPSEKIENHLQKILRLIARLNLCSILGPLLLSGGCNYAARNS